MKPPLWKSLLSYLHDIHIEDAPSYINPHLFVNLSKGRYQLVTSNAIYSYADLYGNFVKAFKKLRWDLLPGDQMLILGFGLGSIPYMLETKFHRSLRYTAVELDEQVIYLAGKYVLDELKSPIDMHHLDAEKFIKQSSDHWDIICIDLFIDDVIPTGALTRDFLIQVKGRLTEKGLLFYNCLSRTPEDVQKTRHFLNEDFLVIFPKGGYLDVGGNWMLTNDKQFFDRQPL